jgi:hypothetical protein
MEKIFLWFLFFSSVNFPQTILSNQWILFNHNNSLLSSNNILSIISPKEFDYWIVTGIEYYNGIIVAEGYLHHFENGYVEIFDETNSPLKKNIAIDLAMTFDSKLLVATGKGLYIKGNNGWDSLNTNNSPLPDNLIYRITVDKLNRYWLGLPNYGIVVYDSGSWTFYHDQNSFQGIADFNFIEIDTLNNIWVGTDYHGLYSFNGSNWIRKIYQDSFDTVRAIVGFAVDNQNNKWVGIYDPIRGSKIALIGNDSPFVYYNLNDLGYSSSQMSYDGVVVDKYNIKFFATTDGLIRYDDTNWTKLDTTNSPTPSNYFKVGYVDSRNNKIFGLANFSPRKENGLIFYNEDSVVVTSLKDNAIIYSYQLFQNYPNPFNPKTKIKYSLPQPGIVQIKVYNILGSEIMVLENEYKQAGIYETDFDASGLSSGIYFYRIISGSYLATRKMVFLR